jgi:integrase
VRKTCAEWISLFKADFFARGGTESTWTSEYYKMLKRLPQNKCLTRDLLHQVVLDTEVHTRSRVRAVMVTGRLAAFANLKYDPSPYRGKYRAGEINPRDIPNDDVICEWYDKLTNPGWKWVYGMLATYGLRPHEVFRLDLDAIRNGDRVIQVLRPTKTGSRQVWAFHPEWVERFGILTPVLPPINLDRPNTAICESAGRYFGRHFGLPFPLYNLRHAWSIRTFEYGLPIDLSSKQMGHSVEVHSTIYHRWINRSVHQRAYDAVLNRTDRPKPPCDPRI